MFKSSGPSMISAEKLPRLKKTNQMTASAILPTSRKRRKTISKITTMANQLLSGSTAGKSTLEFLRISGKLVKSLLIHSSLQTKKASARNAKAVESIFGFEQVNILTRNVCCLRIKSVLLM